jgi:hypothetical protein
MTIFGNMYAGGGLPLFCELVREAALATDSSLNAYNTRVHVPENQEAEAAKTQRLRALRMAKTKVTKRPPKRVLLISTRI